MNRVKLNQVTIRRIYDAFMRRLKDIPDTLAWNINSELSINNNTINASDYEEKKRI